MKLGNGIHGHGKRVSEEYLKIEKSQVPEEYLKVPHPFGPESVFSS
jgi:hypothetical protein